MIYTVGHEESYLTALRERDDVVKLRGGSVWRDRESAQRYLDRTGLDDWAVFAVKAEWDRDTEPVEGVAWFALTIDAVICPPEEP